MHKWYSMDEFKKLVGLNLINPKTDQKTSTQTLRKFAKENLAEGLHYKKLGNGRIVFAPEAVAVFFDRSLVKTETKKMQEAKFKDYIIIAARVQKILNELYEQGKIIKKVRWAYTRKLVADAIKANRNIVLSDINLDAVAVSIAKGANALPPQTKKRLGLDQRLFDSLEGSQRVVKEAQSALSPRTNPYIKKRRLRK